MNYPQFETILSQISSKNEGFYYLDSSSRITEAIDPTELMEYYQIFYTFGGKVWDYGTDELLFNNGKMLI